MAVHHELFELETDPKPSFYDVTEQVKAIVTRSGIRDGIAVVYSQHTTCSIMIQEESHDTTLDGTKYLLQDLLDIFQVIIPQCRREGQYLHPGPQHIAYAIDELGEKAIWSLNTDAHLRSSLMGRSETIPLVQGKLELGQFGQVYFIDFDGTRARKRIGRVQVLGDK
jgi:secondary thiamine-phosphate synthase enzyme